jgi:hypothetical protein
MKENRIWHTYAAKDWNEATPLGNGRLGMMVFGGETEDRIQLNEETFWSGWEYLEYDSPETAAHLEEMRSLIFEGKYTEAQNLSNRYMVCRGNGHHDAQGAFGSYQTAGDILITFPNVPAEDPDYCRTLYLDEGRAEVVCNGMKREYFTSFRYNTAVIRVQNCPAGTGIRYARENTTVIYDPGEIIAVASLPTKAAVVIRHERRDGDLYLYVTAATNYNCLSNYIT